MRVFENEQRRWKSAGIGTVNKRLNFDNDVEISLHWTFSDRRMFVFRIAMVEIVETGEQLLQDQEH